MNKLALNLITILLLVTGAFAQPDTLWTRILTSEQWDGCEHVSETNEGAIFLVGLRQHHEHYDSTGALLTKLGANGDSLWQRTYYQFDYPYFGMVATDQEDAYVAGTIVSATTHANYLLVRVDSTGDLLWEQTYGTEGFDFFHTMVRSNDGSLLLAGTTTANGYHYLLVKVDRAGNHLWSRSIGTFGNYIEECHAIIQSSDGGYLLAGFFYSDESINDLDMWLLKVDEDGDSLWSKTYGGDRVDACYDLVQTIDGGYVLVGETESYANGDRDFWILKVDSNGDSLWSRTFGAEGVCAAFSVEETPSGGLVIAGQHQELDNGPTDYRLIRIDASGDSLWSQTYGTLYSETCRGMCKSSDGGYILIGSTNAGWLHTNLYIVKTTPDPITESADYTVTLPSSYNLSVYPNPFNPSTTVQYSLSSQTLVTLRVYDLLGRQVAELVNRTLPAGTHLVEWNAADIASGSYLIELRGNNIQMTKKALLLR